MRFTTILATTCLFGLGAVVANAQDVWDSDADGFDDNNDNCTLTANALQRDTDGDYMGNRCDADFNNDGQINFVDLEYMKLQFFSNGDLQTDLDGDGRTNFVDLNLMAGLFFTNPGPTGTDPNQPPCTCYFSGDCNDGDPTTPQMFCDYGPGSFQTEDICVWRDIKPNNVYGAGCSIESDLTTGAWVPNVCDGVCVSNRSGSSIGLESKALVAQTVSLWGNAMLQPSVAGGGPVDAELANAASAMQFNAEGVPLVLGRQVADALAMAAGEPFHNYFCHYEGHPDDANPPVVNLAGDSCRIAAGQLTVEALASEIRTPGSAEGIMRNIVNACPDWQNMFATQCPSGSGALKCAIDFIKAQAYFLSNPPNEPSARPDPVRSLLEVAQR